MAKSSSKNQDITINIKAMPVQMHIGSQKYINDDWGTMAYIIDRREIQNKFSDPELRYNCIYFLFGYENNIEMCYVGQAKKRNDGESVLARLREHDKSTTEKYRDIWDWAVVVTNKNDSWTLDDLNALEHAFYAEIPTEHNLNGNTPNAGGADFEKYTDKINQIKALVATIGFSIFVDKAEAENIQVISETNEFSVVEDLQNGMARIPEIVTPHKVVKAMVDMLPAGVWNSHTVFLDPACKGGEYLREIYDRLMENETIQAEYPNAIERSNHILSEQIYGIALSQVSLERTTKKLMGFGINIRVIPNYIEILKTKFIGDNPEESKRLFVREKLKEAFGKEMKIDVVIGNPPYQESTGGGSCGGSALYPRFIDMGKHICNTCMSMITPSRYFTGGQGITKEWKKEWINDSHIKSVNHFTMANTVFPGTSIAGGVSYFLWERNSDNNGETDLSKNIIIFSNEDTCEKTIRQFNESENFITNSIANSIICKVKDYIKRNKIGTLDSIMLARADGYYGLGGGYRQDDGDIIVRQFGGDQKCYSCQLKNQPLGYRVYTAGKLFDRTEMIENNTVLSAVKILGNNEICNGSYILFKGVKTLEIAENIRGYIKTKLVRLLLLKNANGNNISRETFNNVPILNFNYSYTDEILYSKQFFDLSNDEIAYIEKVIKTIE